MFKFLKDKNDAKLKDTSENVVPKESTKKILEEIRILQSQIDEEVLDSSKISCTYNKIGTLYLEIHMKEDALAAFEKAFSFQKEGGESYKQLLSLYTKLQIESAVNSDFDKERYYADKLNDLRTEAKKIITG